LGGFFIHLGFGRPPNPGEVVEGSIVFFEGQKERIINFDETDVSLDNTGDSRGGRPATALTAPEISSGMTQANKSGSSNTMITGSSAAGSPLPPQALRAHAIRKAAEAAEERKADE
jgi:hypothetical protein